MAWGDMAKEAMAKAIDAYKASVRVEALMEVVQKGAEAFERRIEAAKAAFEQRIEARLSSNDQKSESKFDAMERRLREMEVRVSTLTGKVEGGFVEAVRLTLIDPEIQRRLAASIEPNDSSRLTESPVSDPYRKKPDK